MNNRWHDDGPQETRRAARWPRETGPDWGRSRSRLDEERAFGPPRGEYDSDRGIGEAVNPAGQVFGQRESGADYTGRVTEGRYWGGYDFGPTSEQDWYETERDAGDLRRRARRLGRDGGPYARPGRGGDDRGFWDRMSDEAASWFGDPYARERREEDHRGRGPKGYRRSDARIDDDVHERLTEDRLLDASDIEVRVQDGEVTLNGFVRERRDKHRAEHLVEHVSGVQHVQNNLRVRQGAAGDAGAAGAPEGTVLDRQASDRG